MRRLVHFLRGDPHDADEPYVQLMVAYVDTPITDKQRLVTAVRGFPLTWWVVWCNILFATTFGVVTALSDESRFSSHIFDGAKATLAWLPGEPMEAWGWAFVLGGAFMAAGTYLNPLLVVWSLRIGATVYLLNAFLIGLGASEFSTASWSGTLFCLYVAVIHLACAQSILMILRYRFPKGRT